MKEFPGFSGGRALVGRDSEMAILKQRLAEAIAGKGSTVLISGEPGIGKTALVDAFREHAAAQNVKVLSGAASADSSRPFLVFSRAMEGISDRPLFEEQKYTSFLNVFAINHAGMLVARASSGEEEMDADIFAGMLSAVQNFVGDSLARDGDEKAGLGRLEYGDMKILIEHGKHLFLTGVFSGGEHLDMKGALRRALLRIEEEHGAALERWSGKVSEVEPVSQLIGGLIESRFPVRRSLEGVRLEGERVRMAESALGALGGLDSEGAVVLLLEDLHWADESSLFVLEYLARNIPTRHILLLGTARPESENLGDTVASMKGEGIVESIDLLKLDMQGTKGIINNTFAPNDFPDKLVEQLYEQSKGNPLFVAEMLKQMLRDRSIAYDAGKYTLLSESFTVPATVEDVVNRRLDGLDPGPMALAEYMSCIGLRFDEGLAVSNPRLIGQNDMLGELLASGIIFRSNGNIEFSHAVFQSVIYNGLGDRWRAVNHKTIGEYIERSHGGDLGSVIYELARHFSKTSEHGKCADYCVRAGEAAEASYAVEQAIQFYARALDSLPGLDEDAAGKGARESTLRERIGDLNTIVGKWDAAQADMERARELATLSSRKADILRKIAAIHERRGDYQESRNVCGQGLELLGDGMSIEKARLIMARGWTWLRTGDYQKATEDFMTGLHIAKSIGDRMETAYAHHSLGTVSIYQEDYPLALEHLGKALLMREESGDLKGASRTMNNLGMVYSDLGRFDEALTAYEQSLEIMRRTGDRNNQGNLAVNIGMTYSDIGELEKALRYTTEGYEIARSVGDKSGSATALNNLGNIHFDMGEADRAMNNYEAALKLRVEIGDQYGIAMTVLNMADQYLHYGDLEKAGDCFSRSMSLFSEIGERRGLIHAYTGLVDLHLTMNDSGNAMDWAMKALEISNEIGARFEEGMSRHALAKALVNRGDMQAAQREYEETISIFKALKGIKDLAKAYYGYGSALLRTGEKKRGRTILLESLGMFDKMGMRLWADKCRRALEPLTPPQ